MRLSKWIVCYAVFVFCLALNASAIEIGEDDLDISLDFTYATEYNWHGYDVYNDHGAFQPSFSVEYKGFYAGALGSWADTQGYVDQSEVNFFVGYESTFWDDEWYAIYNYITYTYYTHPNTGDRLDIQELANGMSFPNLIPIGESHLVPYYDSFYVWAGVQGSRFIDNGNIHEFGLYYDLPIPALIAGQESQLIHFDWDITYNDGTLGSDSTWSHTAVGVSTTFEWNGVHFIPSVFYQWSLDNSVLAVNPEDELYAKFTVGYQF